jgi:DNA repair exonuclease SbcCD ATPase subunit
VRKKRRTSRADRWADLAKEVEDLAEQLKEKLEALAEVKQEYEDWAGNLPENLMNSPMGEKLTAICDLDLEPDLSSLEGLSDMDLPLGFGRD